MTEKISIAKNAGKALILYMRRGHSFCRDAIDTPNNQTILSAYGHIVTTREDMLYQHSWIMAAIDAVHFELVTNLIGVAKDEAVLTILKNDPVLRRCDAENADDEVTTEEEEA